MKSHTPKTGEPVNLYASQHGVTMYYSLLKAKGLPGYAKLMLCVLAWIGGEDGEIHPRQKYLADMMGLTERGVRKILSGLVQKGILKIIPPTGFDRIKHYNNTYVILRQPWMGREIRPYIPREERCSSRREERCSSANRIRYIRTDTVAGANAPRHGSRLNTKSPDKSKRHSAHPRWGKYATCLAKAIRQVKKINYTSHVPGWSKSFELLHTRNGVSTKRIRAALKWYCANLPSRHGDKYFLVIHSGAAFREKFIRLEESMARDAEPQGGYGGAGEDGRGVMGTGEEWQDPSIRVTKIIDPVVEVR